MTHHLHIVMPSSSFQSSTASDMEEARVVHCLNRMSFKMNVELDTDGQILTRVAGSPQVQRRCFEWIEYED